MLCNNKECSNDNVEGDKSDDDDDPDDDDDKDDDYGYDESKDDTSKHGGGWEWKLSPEYPDDIPCKCCMLRAVCVSL